MSLVPSSRLGPYEIVSRLGAGAMGEVYRARDPRLGRDVAIKILPADVASDAARQARFEQEARAVAALNHPNILGLYDIGNEGGVAYIVTEFVAGETLATMLERGPMPVRKLLDIAVQIADGMAAAHAAQITHRDLKPLNIMVRTDGRVRILDFGLAKQTVRSADPDETVAAGHTQPGMILGTVNYMSPEQARGAPADYRSDQFSFGLILYEMVTGKRAFERAESVQTMSAIIGDDPPPIDQKIPAPLAWVIERCLAKDPADRYESSRDLFQTLRSVRDHASQTSIALPAEEVVAEPVVKKRPLPWTLAAAFGLGLFSAVAIHWMRSGPAMPDQSMYRFTPFSFAPGGQARAVWSPDGKAVAYAASEVGGPYETFIRYLDSPTPVQLTHTAENAKPAAWAPDGKRLLLEIDRPPYAIWSIATVGGEPEVVIPNLPPSQFVRLSPDLQSLAYFYPGDDGRYGVWISSPPKSPPKRYLPDPYATKDVYNIPKLEFAPDGRQMLLMVNAGRQREEAWLLPYPANPSQPPRRVFPNLQSLGGTPTFGWMPDSRHVLLALAATNDASTQLWLGDTKSGEYHAITSGTDERFAPAVSPDGRRVIFTEGTGSYDIVSADLATAAVHPLITTERDEVMPCWAANKPLLAYVTDRNGPPEIWLRGSDNAERPLVTARDFPGVTVQWLMGPALSPEGDRVIYTRIDVGSSSSRLWISAVAGGTPVPLTNGHASVEYPGSWSNDGSWFAYVQYTEGKAYLSKVKTSGEADPVTIKPSVDYDNSAVPVWSPDGAWILLGETLYAADGHGERSLGNHHSDGYVFAPDGKVVYGLRPKGQEEELFTVEVATGAERVIGNLGKNRPRSNVGPAIRFSLEPGGKSIAYGVGHFQDNLWMLEGFAPKLGLFQRLGL